MRRREPSAVRSALGDRARDALFDLAGDGPRLVEIDIATIEANPDQPRQQIDPLALAELAVSIERHGLLQPIIVQEWNDRYLLVAGQRRLLAHRQLRRSRIPALIVKGAADELALIENLQRQDLMPLEEAAALARLRMKHGYSQDELAQIVAKAKSTISELLSLNDLPEAIKDEIRTADPPVAKSVLVELARTPGKEAQLAMWRRLRRRGATVRAARAGRRPAGSGHGADPPAAAMAAGQAFLASLASLDAKMIGRNPALRRLMTELRARLAELVPG
jgi:ParB family chromosome partitioning protein